MRGVCMNKNEELLNAEITVICFAIKERNRDRLYVPYDMFFIKKKRKKKLPGNVICHLAVVLQDSLHSYTSVCIGNCNVKLVIYIS